MRPHRCEWLCRFPLPSSLFSKSLGDLRESHIQPLHLLYDLSILKDHQDAASLGRGSCLSFTELIQAQGASPDLLPGSWHIWVSACHPHIILFSSTSFSSRVNPSPKILIPSAQGDQGTFPGADDM